MWVILPERIQVGGFVVIALDLVPVLRNETLEMIGKKPVYSNQGLRICAEELASLVVGFVLILPKSVEQVTPRPNGRTRWPVLHNQGEALPSGTRVISPPHHSFGACAKPLLM
jgi:hypothetical protein